MTPEKTRLADDVATAADEVAGVLERFGLKTAAQKARSFAERQRYANVTADKVNGAVELAKVAYGQSATKRVIDAVGKKMNEHRSPLGRIVGRRDRRPVTKKPDDANATPAEEGRK